MRRLAARWLSRLAPWGLGLGGLFVVASCQSSSLELCGQIPGGGCPIGRGGTCKDTACAALYDCQSGSWTQVEQCPAGQGEEPSSGPTAIDSGCEKVSFDRSKEATGCTPDLMEPDCPAAAAELCPSQVCTTGCSDFFLCEADGWVDVAHCTPEGQLILLQ